MKIFCTIVLTFYLLHHQHDVCALAVEDYNPIVNDTRETEIAVKDLVDDKKDISKEAQVLIQQHQEENVLLKKILDDMRRPLDGSEELLRQEKIRVLMSRVTNNIEAIERARKDQERQMKFLEHQRKIAKTQHRLP